jgi:hypothetical protein
MLKRSLWFKRGKCRRDFNREGKEGEGRRDLLFIYMFGSKEGRGGKRMNFNCKCVWFTREGEV